MLKSRVNTEEATKTSFILPLLQILGYDVFNPFEVVPEFDAVRGIKKGEKVDYCILVNDKPAIIIECKAWNEKLQSHDGQLFRYFHVTECRLAILTNGIQYKFFSDLSESNKMDEHPFFEFDITDLKDEQIEELDKFSKSNFDIDAILSNAETLKLSQEIKNLFAAQLASPSEAFVKFFASNIFQGKINAKVLERFTSLVPVAIAGYVQDTIRKSLRSALNQKIDLSVNPETPNAAPSTPPASQESSSENKDVIVTTAEEMEAFFIIKSILRTVVPGNKIYYRDGQSYFAIIFDDNNRKPIARLYFNGKKKQVSFFSPDGNKVETKRPIEHLDEIYELTAELTAVALYYNQ